MDKEIRQTLISIQNQLYEQKVYLDRIATAVEVIAGIPEDPSLYMDWLKQHDDKEKEAAKKLTQKK